VGPTVAVRNRSCWTTGAPRASASARATPGPSPVALDDHVEIRRRERGADERVAHDAGGEIAARASRFGDAREHTQGLVCRRGKPASEAVGERDRRARAAVPTDRAHEPSALADHHQRRASREMTAHAHLARVRLDDRQRTREHRCAGVVDAERRRAREVVAQDEGIAGHEHLSVTSARGGERLRDRDRDGHCDEGDVDQRGRPDFHLRIPVRAGAPPPDPPLDGTRHQALGWDVRYMRASASDGRWV
jgi:hypothetical protein